MKLKLMGMALFLMSHIKIFAQNTALNFDGIDDYVETQFYGVSGTAARTIETWIRTTANCDPNNGGKQKVICDYGSTNTGARFTLNILFGNRPRIEIGGSGLMGNSVVNDGKWHQIAVSYDPSHSTTPYKLYVDGKLDTAGNITTNINTSNSSIPFRIGMRCDNANPFEGDIDEVKFYNIVLSDSMIKANYKREYCKIPNGLIAYYKLNEGTANSNNSTKKTATDYSGNSKNGTLNNFTLSGSSSNWISGPTLNGGNTTSTISAFECSSYIAPSGKKFIISGTFKDVIPNYFGCDSTITIKLTIGNKSKDYTYTVCDSFVSNSGVSYYKSGTYTESFKTYMGCDSVVRYNLKIYNAIDTVLNVESCDSFVSFLGKRLFQSGTCTDTFKRGTGCDSFVHYKVVINNSIVIYDTLIVCDTAWIMGKPFLNSQQLKFVYKTSKGCDSTRFLNLIVNKSVKTVLYENGCQSFTSNSGKIYTESGTYKETFSSHSGCDSNVFYQVTIFNPIIRNDTIKGCKVVILRGNSYSNNQIVQWKGISFGGCDSTVNTYIDIIKPDVTVKKSMDTLFANGQIQSLQWLNCSNFSKINGATKYYFKPTINGEYAVEANLNGCRDTSECIIMNGVGLKELSNINVVIYPNPSHGSAVLLSRNGLIFKVRIFDFNGKLIYEMDGNHSNQMELPQLNSSTYLVQLTTESGLTQQGIWVNE